jgi:hypothetical protein
MSGLLGAGAWAADLVLAMACAWLLVRWLAPGLPGLAEPLIAWALAFGVTVVGGGMILGETGYLGAAGFLGIDGLLLALLLYRRWGLLAGDAASLRAGLVRLGDWRRQTPFEAAAFGTLIALWALTAGLAALGEPFVYDALTYHLPRIGQWLQDGRVGHYATADPRQNFMFVAPELFTAWLLLAVPSGFQGAALAQGYSGALLLLSTYLLARQTRLSRMASYGAAALLFGMANVVPQFTCVYTDIFAAAVLAGSFCLWLGAMRRREGSVLAGLGAGLALGSKTTVLYLGPGIVVWVAYVAWRNRTGARAWTATLVPALVSALFFILPVCLENGRDYGGLLGPDYMVRLHHGDANSGSGWAKLSLNLESSFAQVFDPNSQAPLLAAPARAAGEAVARGLPEHDKFMEDLNVSRRQVLLDLFALKAPDTDQTSFGLLALVGLAGGAVAAALRRRPGSQLVLAWCAGIAAFWIFFHALHQWATYGFRIYVMVAPWMAVVTAWWLESLPRVLNRFVWTLWLASAACVTFVVLTLSTQAGLRPIEYPSHSIGFLWRQWAGGLDGHGALHVALPYNRPVAAFYRLASGRTVVPEFEPGAGVPTAESWLGGRNGWLVVPAARFQGREGDVVGETWLFRGDGADPFSLAAYRTRRPGETPPPILYRRERSADPHLVRLAMVVRLAPNSPPRRLTLAAGSSACRYALVSPVVRDGALQAGETAEVALPPSVTGMIRIEATFRGLGEGDPAPPDADIFVSR